MNKNKDTIFALSTPSGKSAISVIRISGSSAYKAVKKISLSMPKLPNKATLNTIIDEKKLPIDKSITTYFKSPKSYTGEDMVEISFHGSSAVINKFFDTIKKNKKVRIAEPGEFTKRAFENNKFDLTQVEAISDLVNAETEIQRKFAYSQLEGNFSIKTKKIYNDIQHVLANTESLIDFADDDLPKNLEKNIKEQIENIIKEIKKILKNKDYGIKIRDGYTVAIVGKPNTGKSSLINNISDRDISIVTNIPGTTRDSLESYINIYGAPLKFIDTAGIRKSKNIIEKIGVKKTIKIIENSDFNIVLIEKMTDIKDFENLKNPIYAQSKLDIRKKPIKNKKIINISSKTGKGIKKLLQQITKKIEKKTQKENIYISRERHVYCLEKTLKHLVNARNKKNYDIFSEDIRISLREISKIYGNVDIEDILGIIFNDFCIGK